MKRWAAWRREARGAGPRRRNVRRSGSVALAVLAGLAGLADVAVAAEGRAEVRVWTIRATRSNAEISPELKSLAEKLKRQFNYTGYKLVSRDSRSLDQGQEARFSLPEPYVAAVTLAEVKDKSVTLRVRIIEKSESREVVRLNTSFTVQRGLFQLCGGLKLDGDDVLIVALSGG
ncbi:MAG: hypothetical protein CHACPFDD_00624 [Phycisphaerae bacterium]|nr:hypothetical protein [Phycisphaerae bacterium]